MNHSTIIGLVNNAALLLALALIYDMLGERPRGGKPEPRQFFTGMIIGLMGIAVMMNPWEFAPGIAFDTRSVLLSMSGLFFGTVPTLLAALMTAIFRLSLGGAGAWPAMAAIAAASGIGLAWRHLRRSREQDFSTKELFLLGIVVHLAMLLSMLLLLPRPVGPGVVFKIGVPIMLICPLTTAILGRLMASRGERRRMEAALQKSKRRHRTILQTAMNGFLMMDMEGRILEVNDTYCRLTGYGEAELLTMHVYDLDDLEAAADSARHIQRIAVHGQDRFVSRHRRKNGDVFDVEVSAQYSPEEGGCFVAFVQDITERLVRERRLHQAEKAESLSRMAGAVAHHFNNMLSAVMGNLDLARMDLSERDGVAESLTDAYKATRRAADMSRLMLTFLGQTPSKPIPIDLSGACRDCLTELKGEIPGRVTLETDLPGKGPMVKADPGQIGQILTILVANSWEAMGDAEGQIRVSLSTANRLDIRGDQRFPVDWQPSTDGYACLTVSDNGSGMSPEIIDRIFDPFYTEKLAGRGLGLPVALGIVKSFDGCILVESDPGKGSTFRVFLPLSSEALTKTVPEKPAGEQEIAAGGFILLVEDQQMVRDAVEAMLKHFGFEVLTARDGVEAVEIFRDRAHDIRLVLTDLSMPRMNGWETLKALRKIQSDIPVILASGYDEARSMAAVCEERPQVFLSKPYQMATLKAALVKALGSN